MNKRIPLFPLNTVLFPQGVLPLRIFEPRYLDMISDCMKTDSGIGVILISDGKEVGKAASTYDVGTLSEINYWHKRPDGLLGITLKGLQRFKVIKQEVQSNQLIVAEVEFLPEITSGPVPEEFQPLVNLLQRMMTQLEPPYSTISTHYDDMDWVSARLTELLPFSMELKQSLLLIEDALERLQELKQQMDKDNTR